MSAFEPPEAEWCPECSRYRLACAHLEPRRDVETRQDPILVA